MEIIEQIRELFARLTELTPEELETLDGLCDQYMEATGKDDVVPDLAEMDEVVKAAEGASAEGTRRTEAEAAAQAQAEELRSRFKTVRGQADEGEGEGEGEGTPAAPADGDAGGESEGEGDAGAGDGTPVPVAASAGVPNRASRMAARTGRVAPGTGQAEHRGRVTITASGAGRTPVGTELDRDGLAKAMTDVIRSMDRKSAARGPVIVASADYTELFPEERRLGSDAFENGLKLSAEMNSTRAGLTASGGICSPGNIDWSIPTWAVADTPLIDSLSDFQTDRGALTFTPPPDFAALAGATEVWTEAMDAAAPGNGLTKPVLSVQCGSPVTINVDAVPTRLGFGNMMGRFAPEWTAANTELALVAASRLRELNMLTHIDASSTLVNSYALLGTARDILATVDQLVAYYRDVHRLGDAVDLTAVFPRWVKDMCRADIARELAHDEDDSNPFSVPDAVINAWFTARNVTPVWMFDGRAAKTTGGALYQYPAQTYTKVSANSPIAPWINKTVWNLYMTGTFQRLDAGVMDIGVVRDSTLDATNDYEIFNEVFEGVAFRGLEALTIVSPLLPNGGSAGTIATSTYTGA
jgi:hypothetical protein